MSGQIFNLTGGKKKEKSMEEKIIEYAPILIVVLLFFIQNNFFVKPEELEKIHREIIEEMNEKMDDIKDDFSHKYVELNAYKEFQTHISSELEKVRIGIDELKAFLIAGKENR
ncbi:MAG: hypothetical protein SPL73_08145 [Cyanobacteriota bacterium]|nr:hypothetical protein [Cyanobacteriota bacterium]MDY6364841.1 hypothetical protein [Cyanobacteriota bacterium]